MRASQASIAETLTRAEREAPFAIAAVDREPLPAVTRTQTEWDGDAFTEIDPATWSVVALGCVDREGARC